MTDIHNRSKPSVGGFSRRPLPIAMVLSVIWASTLLAESSPKAIGEEKSSTQRTEQSADPVGQENIPWFFVRCFGWSVIGLFGAGGLGGYLRRRPTAWCVVGIWYFAAYHIYASWRLEISVIPPLLAIALSGALARIAKVANDEAVQEGRRQEEAYKFSSNNTLSMAFIYITIGLMVTTWFEWKAWDIIPGFRQWPLSRKVVVGIMIASTGMSLMMWIDTLAHAGRRVLASVPTMAALFLRSRRGRFLIAIAVFCICFWHSPFAKEPQPLRWEMTFSLLFAVAMLWLQPPYVLMLGASSKETGAALGKLASAAFPFRVVALLDRSRTGYIFSPFSWWTDDLRTNNERDWRWVVDRLIEVVPTTVLDARTTRGVVVYEARQILERGARLQRSTFVICDDRTAPALELNGESFPYTGIRVIHEGDIEKVLDFAAVTEKCPRSPEAKSAD